MTSSSFALQWRYALVRLPSLDAACSVALLEELSPAGFCRVQSVPDSGKRFPAAYPTYWWPLAGLAASLSALCALFFASIAKFDQGSAIFFHFVLHTTVVVMYIPRASTIWQKRRTPLKFLIAASVLWCFFVVLKADSHEKLPMTSCLLLSNLRTPLGVFLQRVMFQRQYSSSQWAGFVLLCLSLAGAARRASSLVEDGHIYVAEIVTACFLQALQSSVMKISMLRFGGSIQEYFLVTHLAAICFVFPFYWGAIEQHVGFCMSRRDSWLSSHLAIAVALHFASRSVAARLARHSPSVLGAEVVQASAGCLQFLCVALVELQQARSANHLLHAIGIGLALLGFVRNSRTPEEDDEEKHDFLMAMKTPTLRATWAVATTEAKQGNIEAARRENMAWRRLGMRQRLDISDAFSRQTTPGFEAIGHAASLEELLPVRPEEQKLPCLIERAFKREQEQPGLPYFSVAVFAIVAGSGAVVPYALLLNLDPGSPLCYNFILHVVVLVSALPRLNIFLYRRKIPLTYHAAIAALWCLFTVLKSDAYTRLPTSVCMLLSNSRMIVGVLLQSSFFGKRYSSSQLLGAGIVTLGIAWAGNAMQQASAAQTKRVQGSSPGFESDFLIGVAEVLGSTTALALQNSLLKITFSKFGEHIDEQVFFTHLCAILVVFPSCWHLVGPRLSEWTSAKDARLLTCVAFGVLLSFGCRNTASLLAGRVPNLLVLQLIQTVDGFLQLLVAALLRVPPWPPSGFWGGALVLLLGTLQYLRASDAPPRKKDGADNISPDFFTRRTPQLRAEWAVATKSAAKHGSSDATRRENLAWRKLGMHTQNSRRSSKEQSSRHSSKESIGRPSDEDP